METSTTYQGYIGTLQNSSPALSSGSFSEAFETLYHQAIDSGVTLGNAVSFLENLSADALKSLQEYAGLTDEIDVSTLSAEGAYNLLLHAEEQCDFNNDGTVEVGNLPNDDAETTDSAVEKFLHDLRTKGAAKFLADLNQEKIDKMVEEYRQKLIAQMGDSSDAMAKIEKMINDFRKQLIEEMLTKMEDENERKNENTFISAETMMFALMDSQKQQKQPLEVLLQSS